jgi:hypothetical protein
MDETTAFHLENPSSLDLEVAGFREQFDGRVMLDELVRRIPPRSARVGLHYRALVVENEGGRSGPMSTTISFWVP